jgi:hypothetical protein
VEEIIQLQLDEELKNNIMTALFSDWLQQQLEEIQIVTEFQGHNQQSLTPSSK